VEDSASPPLSAGLLFSYSSPSPATSRMKSSRSTLSPQPLAPPNENHLFLFPPHPSAPPSDVSPSSFSNPPIQQVKNLPGYHDSWMKVRFHGSGFLSASKALIFPGSPPFSPIDWYLQGFLEPSPNIPSPDDALKTDPIYLL